MKGESPMPATKSAIARGMPRNAAALPRIEAPSRIMAIIEQVSTAPVAMSRNAFAVRPPCSAATMNAQSTLGFGDQRGAQRRMDHDPGHEAAGEQKARDEAGGEQFQDRDVAEHAIDDHDVRRRDQEPERAGAGEAADRD